MKKEEVVFIPAQAERKEVRVTGMICDICKTESPELDNWDSKPHQYIRTTVLFESGHEWPNGENDQSERTEFDICPKCFKEVLSPFIKNRLP